MGSHLAPRRVEVGALDLTVSDERASARRVVRVAVDVPALADQRREFDYLVPPEMDLSVGSLVRVPLHGRRVGGWVVADFVDPPAGVRLQRVGKVTGHGPAPDVVDLTEWAAWRWAGRRTAFLRTASPQTAVRTLPRVPSSRVVNATDRNPVAGVHNPRTAHSRTAHSRTADSRTANSTTANSTTADSRTADSRTADSRTADSRTADSRTANSRTADSRTADSTDEAAGLARDALAAGEAVVRLAPASDPIPVLRAIIGTAPALVICASVDQARAVARRLNQSGVPTATVSEGWARAAGGGVTVIGARAAAWAPAPAAGVIVVLDAHDHALTEERAPTWNAWVVAAERARRASIPCILVSPCPTLEQLKWGQIVLQSRAAERAGWARVEIVDRTADDPRTGLLSERLVPLLRAATLDQRVVCVLNRKGRIRLLACRACGRLATCEHCGGAMEQPGPASGQLRCRRCGRERPRLCQACGSTALRNASNGVTKVREDLAALSHLPVGEVTAETSTVPDTPVIIGTEAALHRVDAAHVVAFLDFDAELLAPRYRAAEDALALLARASRVVGGRAGAGRILVQTRQPRHTVLEAAIRADPMGVAAAEQTVRSELRLPPFSALAEVSGEAETTATFTARIGEQLGVEVLGPTGGPTGGRWLLRANDHRILCDALAATGRPAGADGAKLRIEMDPLRA